MQGLHRNKIGTMICQLWPISESIKFSRVELVPPLEIVTISITWDSWFKSIRLKMSDKKLSQTAKKVPSKSGSGPGGTLGGADGGNKIESSKRPPPPPPAKTKLPGFAPYAPVIRPGHYDHIEESLVPPDVDRDAIPRHPLEKSSSSFLKGVVTPSSTPSEEEVSQFLEMMRFLKNNSFFKLSRPEF